MLAPLVVLAVLAVVAGFVETPETFGGITLFTRFLAPALPALEEAGHEGGPLVEWLPAVAALAGIGLAWQLWGRRPGAVHVPAGGPLERFLLSGFGFDALYDRLLVRPYNWIARVNSGDVVDGIYTLIARAFGGLSRMFIRSQTGNLRWYAAGLAFGAAVTIAIVVFL